MNLLAWSVRSLGNRDKDALIKNMISKYDADSIGLTETKLLEVAQARVASIWGYSDYQFLYCLASHTGSGVLLIYGIKIVLT